MFQRADTQQLYAVEIHDQLQADNSPQSNYDCSMYRETSNVPILDPDQAYYMQNINDSQPGKEDTH